MQNRLSAYRAVDVELGRLGKGAIVRAQVVYDLVCRRLGRPPDFHAVMSSLGYLAEPLGNGYFRIQRDYGQARQAS